MSTRGQATRERILEATQGLILENGFSATSIDRVLERTGLTKGAFFYHFRNKEALTRAVVQRYAQREQAQLACVLERARQMARDPLQQLLICISLMIESAEEATREQGRMNPGCLFGSYAYELPAVDDDAKAAMRSVIEDWRQMIRRQLDQIAGKYPPRIAVNLDTVADNLLVAFEGGLILGRLLDDARQTAEHLTLYRTYLELLFSPEPAGEPA